MLDLKSHAVRIVEMVLYAQVFHDGQELTVPDMVLENVMAEIEQAIAQSREWTFVEDQVPTTSDAVLLAHSSKKYPNGKFMAVSWYDESTETWKDELTMDPLIPIAYQALPPYPQRREKNHA